MYIYILDKQSCDTILQKQSCGETCRSCGNRKILEESIIHAEKNRKKMNYECSFLIFEIT
jgi:hypothetical protein